MPRPPDSKAGVATFTIRELQILRAGCRHFHKLFLENPEIRYDRREDIDRAEENRLLIEKIESIMSEIEEAAPQLVIQGDSNA